MSVFLNDRSVSALSLTLPRIGVWHADVSLLPDDEVPAGKVTLESFGVKYQGTVLRSDRTETMPFARIVGGAGGFGTEIPAKSYRGTDVELPISEVLSAVGESLSPASDSAPLRLRLPFWVRMQVRAGQALAALLAVARVPAWRVLADGTVWLGTETWPQSKLTDFHVLAQDPHLGRHEIYAVEPSVFPGETWNGMHVSVVEHRFTQDRLVTNVWVES